MKRGFAPAFPLGLVLVLTLPSLGAAELYSSTDQITISAKDLPWALVIPRQGFRLLVNQSRPDGRGGYY